MSQSVYLDWNATTPLRPEAKEAMIAAMEAVGNPSSTHAFGREALGLMEDARERVFSTIGLGAEPQDVRDYQLTFTSGGTEANNLALFGLGQDRPLLASAVEHPCILQAEDRLTLLPVDAQGVVKVEALEQALAEPSDCPPLVCIMLANNETGVLQPIPQIAEIVHKAGALLHVDAVQAVGKIPLEMRALGADSLSLSAHKIGGPKGVGALVCKSDLSVTPLLKGGGQERSRRAGTENLLGIVGFGAAAEASTDLSVWASVEQMRDDLESRLPPGVTVYGQEAPRLPNTSCLGLPGANAATLVMSLDIEGVAVSAGSACSSGKVGPSHVIQAMTGREDDALSAVRVSLGWDTTAEDIARFLSAWEKATSRLKIAL